MINWHDISKVNIVEDSIPQFLNIYNNKNTLLVASKGTISRLFPYTYNGRECSWKGLLYSHFEVNPSLEIFYLNQNLLKELRYTTIIGLGGGSCIDTAKIINMINSSHKIILRSNNYEIRSITNIDRMAKLITIPTTCGTGSEVTSFATCWDKQRNVKYSFESESTIPSIALLDPKLLSSVGMETRICTALDTFSHIFEVLWNKNYEEEMFVYIVKSFKIIIKYLHDLSREITSLNNDREMQIASTLAGCLIQKTKTAAAHSISYPLTLNYDIPHGIACSFTLPELLLLNSRASRYTIIKSASEALGFASIDSWTKELIEIMKSLRVGNYLKPIYETDKWQDLIESMMSSSRMANNVELLSYGDVKEVVKKSLYSFQSV